MMSSWYQNQDNNDDDESGSPNDNLIIDYKLQYQQLKKKLKFLIYVSISTIVACIYCSNHPSVTIFRKMNSFKTI